MSSYDVAPTNRTLQSTLIPLLSASPRTVRYTVVLAPDGISEDWLIPRDVHVEGSTLTTLNMMSFTLVALHENDAVSPNMTVWLSGGVTPDAKGIDHVNITL